MDGSTSLNALKKKALSVNSVGVAILSYAMLQPKARELVIDGATSLNVA
jgi:hypothetical protein